MKQVLLVGNPNCGKTTLFNSLTRSNEHVGNWHGVTTEEKKKEFFIRDEKVMLVDTPGLYSLLPLSFEEQVSVDTINSNSDYKIVNLCDKNNLARSLFLSLCLLERGLDVLIAINNFGKRTNCRIDYAKMKKIFGIDIVEIDAANKEDLSTLQELIQRPKKQANLPYFDNNFKKLDIRQQCEKRYSYIDEIIACCTMQTNATYGNNWFDKIALNRWLAFPIFLLILAGVFYLTFFSLGAFLSATLSKFLEVVISPILNFLEGFGRGWVFDLFDVAIFGGLNTIFTFLPQVVLLFFFLAILEDSGYMSRVAFIFEDILGSIGLSGRSVYTLLMGFGCSTSAIMTSRTMDDKNAKIKTALLCPYMSCSAKIPIYTIIGGAVFGAKNIFVILGLYLLGVLISIFVSQVLNKTILKSEKQSFILEFPPYRRTSLKRVFKIIWKNLKEFVLKVGSIILAMNVVVWFLSSFSFTFAYTKNGGVSIMETFGKMLAPIFSPLGFGNWAIVSCLLSGFVAKEVVVSSIAMFNGIDANSTKLLSNSILLPTSVIFFKTKASILAFLVYCLLYTPCVSSVAMLKQEVGTKWTIFSVISQLFVAYVVSLLTYQIFLAFENFGGLVFVILFAVLTIVFSVLIVIKKVKRRGCCSFCDKCNKKCDRRK